MTRRKVPRAAWDAALDCGVRRVEDVVMDRALNGVEGAALRALHETLLGVGRCDLCVFV